jgi:hypothetical protein
MDPLTLAALISGGATILGGLFGSSAANKAADSQEKVARDALELNKAQIAQARLDATPWMEAGKKALTQYQGELGMGPANFQSQFTETPGYKYQVQEAEKGAVNNLAALGMKNSGAALKALTKVRSGLANQEYNNYTSKISGLAGVGQNQVNQTNAMTQNSVLNQGQLMQDAGAARASGYAGAANSWIGGMNSFANNMGSMLGNYNQDWQRV